MVWSIGARQAMAGRVREWTGQRRLFASRISKKDKIICSARPFPVGAREAR
jgi:hypothetical protein